jgi:plastocyanin
MNKNIPIIIVFIATIIILAGGYILMQQKSTPALSPTPALTPTNIQSDVVDTLTPTEATNANPQTYTVSIQGFAFNPANLTINQGDTVTWTNQDSAAHQIKETTFQSDMLATGQSYSHTFTTAGVYSYYCTVHPSMTGQITVQ